MFGCSVITLLTDMLSSKIALFSVLDSVDGGDGVVDGYVDGDAADFFG